MPNFPVHAAVGVIGGIVVLVLLQSLLGGVGINNLVPFYIPSWDGLVVWVIQWVAIILLLLFSALLPDIDHQNSTITHLLLLVVNILITFSLLPHVEGYFPSDPLVHAASYIILFILTSAITYAVFLFLKPSHRGWVHGLVANISWSIMVYVLWGFNFSMAIVAGVAYFSHLALDCEFKLW